MRITKFSTKEEQRVARCLESHGAKVVFSHRDRSGEIADLKARFSSGKTWYVEVKANRVPPSSAFSKEGKYSIRGPRGGRVVGVVAKVSRRGVEYQTIKGRKLNLPSKKLVS